MMKKIIQVGNTMPDTPRFHNRTPGRVYSSKGLCPTLRNKGGMECHISSRRTMKNKKMPIYIGTYTKRGKPFNNQSAVFDVNGICPTITDGQGGGRIPSIILEDNDEEDNTIGELFPRQTRSNGSAFSTRDITDSDDESRILCGDTSRGGGEMMVKDNNGNHFALRSQNKQLIETIQKNEFKEGEPKVMDLYNRRANEKVSPTLDDPTHNDRRLYDGLRIRRLTPKECWRLMGFSDEDFEKARAVNSDTQLYKQAGNSIVVDVLVAILRNLLTGDREEQEIQRELW